MRPHIVLEWYACGCTVGSPHLQLHRDSLSTATSSALYCNVGLLDNYWPGALQQLHVGKAVTLKGCNVWVQDGRDVPDGTSVKFVEQLEKDLESLDGVDAKIASGGGRMHVTMDRYEVSPALPHRCTLLASVADRNLAGIDSSDPAA